ncbi:MAG: hypothetical protein PUA84_08350, partial [Oscillospiraceae bacterium]|nr:hypothetical protein [Oscillospiraceae bacterium]
FTYQVAAKDMDNEIQFYINKKVNTAISVSDYLTELRQYRTKTVRKMYSSSINFVRFFVR